jgi:D-alanyl-D-alanine carboxypeptidase
LRRSGWRFSLGALALTASVLASAAPAAGTSAAPGNDRAATPAEVAPDLAEELQSIIDAAQETWPIPGVAAVVVTSDGQIWEGGSGQADLEDPALPMLSTTPSVIGSITKTFVAALILQLVDEGRLRLRSRLSRWFPEYSFASQVRIPHLLQHTSGLRDYFKHPDYDRLVFGRPKHHWTTDEILALVREGLLFAPGSSSSYSNTNYLFLGLVAERVTGTPLATQLRSRFFEPLGLSATTYQPTEVPAEGAARGYLWRKTYFEGIGDGTAFRPHTSAATVASAAGGLLSSARDVATWTRALYRGEVLDSEGTARLVAFNDGRFGYGTMRFNVSDTVAWGHTGSLRGYTAVTWYVPAHGLTVTVLTNRGRIHPAALGRELTEAVLRAETQAASRLRPAA